MTNQHRDRIALQDAVKAYMLARIPTNSLTQALIGAFCQMLANQLGGTVTLSLPGAIVFVRKPADTASRAA